MVEEEKEEKKEPRRSTRERRPTGTSEMLRQEETEKMRAFEVARIQKKRIEKQDIKKRIADLKKGGKKKKKSKLASSLDALKELSVEIGNGTGQDVTAVGSTATGQLHAAAQRPQLAQNLRATENGVTWHQDNPGDNVHAEMWLLYLVPEITSISADRAICARCAEVLDVANVSYDKAYIQASTPNWTNPWQRANLTNAYSGFSSYAKDKPYTFTF